MRPGSAFTDPKSGCSLVRSSICSPISGRSSFSIAATTSIEVQDARLEELLAAEGQQLLGQLCGARGGALDLL